MRLLRRIVVRRFRVLLANWVSLIVFALTPVQSLAQVDELLLTCLNTVEVRCVDAKDPDYTFKSLFLSYSDDDGLNHGHALARLNWRLTRELTFSLARTKNLFSYELAEGNEFFDEDFFGQTPPGLDAVSEMTALEFHDAARRIGSEVTAQAVVWGEHYRSGAISALRTSMTLIDDLDRNADSWLKVQFDFDDFRTAFRLPAWEFDFSPTFGLVEDSFHRQLVLRCNERAGCTDSQGIEFYDSPSNSSTAIVGYLPAGERVLGKEVVQKWILIERENGETGYVNVYHIEVVPTYLRYYDRQGINVREGPGTSFPASFQADLNGVYAVLDVANDVAEDGASYASRRENDHIKGNWYQIQAAGGFGWVKGYIPSSGTNIVAAESHIGQRDKSLYFLAALFRFAVANSSNPVVEWQKQENLTEAISLMEEFRYLADPELDNQAIAFSHMISALSYHRLIKDFDREDRREVAMVHAQEAARNLPLFPEPRLLYSYMLLETGALEEADRQLVLSAALNNETSTLDWNLAFACNVGIALYCPR